MIPRHFGSFEYSIYMLTCIVFICAYLINRTLLKLEINISTYSILFYAYDPDLQVNKLKKVMKYGNIITN